ncbi:MAG: hypothetical protein HQK96_06105 [Nitrospirae bacterium]|nr:hypothetical protein [Nitrospirota bacterium]
MNYERKVELVEGVLDQVGVIFNALELQQRVLKESEYDLIVSKFEHMYPRRFDPEKVQKILFENLSIRKSIDVINMLWTSYCNTRRRKEKNIYDYLFSKAQSAK